MMGKIELNVGEYLLKITDVFESLAVGELRKGDGSRLIGADGICGATGAIHRTKWGEWDERMRPGAQFVVWLSPAGKTQPSPTSPIPSGWYRRRNRRRSQPRPTFRSEAPSAAFLRGRSTGAAFLFHPIADSHLESHLGALRL
jgi:hypothetical protein